MDVISTPDSMWIVSGRLVLATALGAAVGYNRELLQKPAGVRTHALTTAASIWVVAAVGIAAGLGLWRTAALTVAIALVVLILGRPLFSKS